MAARRLKQHILEAAGSPLFLTPNCFCSNNSHLFVSVSEGFRGHTEAQGAQAASSYPHVRVRWNQSDQKQSKHISCHIQFHIQTHDTIFSTQPRRKRTDARVCHLSIPLSGSPVRQMPRPALLHDPPSSPKLSFFSLFRLCASQLS